MRIIAPFVKTFKNLFSYARQLINEIKWNNVKNAFWLVTAMLECLKTKQFLNYIPTIPYIPILILYKLTSSVTNKNRVSKDIKKSWIYDGFFFSLL